MQDRIRITVNDGRLNSQPDYVSISIKNVNHAPVADAGNDRTVAENTQVRLDGSGSYARAVPASVWPPNHKMTPIAIAGITDPNDDALTITITGVTQDEPVDGLGDGDTSPDAVVDGANVLLRLERAGNGNGRVYEIRFTADDGDGGACSGSVKVTVPYSRNQADPAVDDGQVYNSL